VTLEHFDNYFFAGIRDLPRELPEEELKVALARQVNWQGSNTARFGFMGQELNEEPSGAPVSSPVDESTGAPTVSPVEASTGAPAETSADQNGEASTDDAVSSCNGVSSTLTLPATVLLFAASN
jgi:hypothetical protein